MNTRTPQWVDAVTFNDDFTDGFTDVPMVLDRYGPGLLGSQESKNTSYRDKVGQRYGVRQRLATNGASGVSVIWDRKHLAALGRTRDRPARHGSGWQPLIKGRSGFTTRGVVWQDLVSEWGLEFRFGSWHRLPEHFSHLWPIQDRALGMWIAQSPLPLLLTSDCNQKGGPDPVVARTKMHWYGVRIDGFLTNMEMRPDSMAVLNDRHSDHDPVRIKANLQKTH